MRYDDLRPHGGPIARPRGTFRAWRSDPTHIDLTHLFYRNRREMRHLTIRQERCWWKRQLRRFRMRCQPVPVAGAIESGGRWR